ncbi:MAG: ATP-binding protein [Candidatus Aenigmarchaeota archaeon]|nr:ATP-binding protein [Candidatus Aenigmarchaeota archaeon]
MEEVVIGRDDEDMKKYGREGTIVLGKHLVGTGEDAHLTTPVLLDVLRPHVLIISGKRGYGKSYSMGIIIEEVLKLPDKTKENICALVLDTQGIFWTMKSPSEKDADLLNDWNLKPKGFDIYVCVPEGQEKTFSDAGVEFDASVSFLPSELKADDWVSVFDLKPNEPLSILLQRSISKLSGNYTIDDIVSKISEQKGFDNEKLAIENMLEAAKTWGIFGEAKMPAILEPGKVTVLDVSLTPQNVRSLLLALISRKIFEERVMARRKEELAEIEITSLKRVPLCWIFIDEAHNFIPDEGNSPSLEIMQRIIKEGRQPGISLILATQRPEKLHSDAIAQCDMIISHRLTAKPDIDSLKAIMQTYMLYDISKYIDELPKLKGTAIILDDNSERIYKIRMRPRQSWHAGASPILI